MTAPALPLTIITPGVYDGIPNETYHADPVAAGSLSFSGAKKLLPPYCPAIYQWEREHPVYKGIFDWGSAAHKLVLNDESAEIVVVKADSWRTKAAQEARDEARTAGLIPMLQDDYQQVLGMALAIQDHPVASTLFAPKSGKPEQSLFWVDPETKVWRRARVDWLPTSKGGRLIVPDYKTAVSADPEKFAKAAMDYAYHSQAAWYIDGLKALGLDDDPAFVFVVQEKNPPYLVTVIELDQASVSIGRNLNRFALNTYRQCRESGRWPGHSDDVELVSLPEWYLRRHDEEPA